MKKLFTYLAVTSITFSIFAQAPQKISYQCVVRNSSGALAANQSIGVKISILQGSASGKVVYQETYNPNPQTNANGLISIEIGGGVPLSGTFSTINWASGKYFLKTETDPAGETNYTISGTSQLLSVPYALHAKTAETISSHYIGESYGGGIVFYVYDGGQHGLIAATVDQNTGIQWYNGTYRYTGTTGDGVGAGALNTAMIIATQISDNQIGNFAAKVCADYSVTVDYVTYGDWYLPSKSELNLLYLQKGVVGGFADHSYWSSTELNSDNAWYQRFITGSQANGNKDGITGYVRAVRAF
jgi:hypothetical protein